MVEEIRRKFTITIAPSVLEAVKTRQEKYGGKISSLIENLLAGWCYKMDQINEDVSLKEFADSVRKDYLEKLKKEEASKK